MSQTLKQEINLDVEQLDGVGAQTKKKLESFGIKNIIDICVRGAKEIQEITSVERSKAVTWVFNSQKILEESNLIRKTDMHVLELMAYHKNQDRISTKCKEIDALFDGGLTAESLYEVYGEFGSGKTQFCLSLTAETLARRENVIWIDCEDTFKPNRLAQIMVAREICSDEEVSGYLENISYYYTPNSEQLMGTIDSLSELMLQKRPRLVVIDGAIGQFREEYLGRGTLAERQNQLARLMTHLKNISFYFRCTVLFTNQVQSDPSIMFGDPIKPIGGNIIAHASTYRVYFKKAGKKRIARMMDSPEHEQKDASYCLNIKGIDDVVE